MINSTLRKLNIERTQKRVSAGTYIPSKEELARVEEYITGRMISLERLIGLCTSAGFKEDETVNIVQTLYSERRIKMIPAVKKLKNRIVCSICGSKDCCGGCIGFSKEDILLYAADNYSLNKPKSVHAEIRKVSEPIKKAREGFSGFIKSKKSYGILWCAPNSFEYDALINGIAEVIKRGGRILYATSTHLLCEVREVLQKSIEGAAVDIIYDTQPDYKKNDICICSYNECTCFYKGFDLVVLDQRYLFLERASQNIEYIYQRAVKEKGKFLNITCCPGKDRKSIFKSSPEVITIPVTYMKNPIPEPRIITSRFLKGADAFFPQIVMDVIRWSMEEGARLIIFVPDEGEVHKVYYYLVNMEGIDKYTIDVSNEKEKSSLMKFKRRELQILVSNDLKDCTHVLEDVNVIVMQSDEEIYRVDTLINIAAMAATHTGKKIREVVFVAAQENETLSLAKSTIRNINRISWEMGYIRG
jgi:late competence protein required for DNA uptake (superfamily II DNA/RNA helicase)